MVLFTIWGWEGVGEIFIINIEKGRDCVESIGDSYKATRRTQAGKKAGCPWKIHTFRTQ